MIWPAEAATTQRSAIEQIGREFSLRISNPIDGTSLPSILYVKSAELSTSGIVGTHAPAPSGHIYLTFSASASPEQLSYGQADWGHFFSTMTPLAPSAVTFRSGASPNFVAHETNPLNQANNPNASSDDGLLDATYWFLIPSNTRSGTVSIGPATTEGTEFESFDGRSTAPLHIDGISFRVSFPDKLAAPFVSRPKNPASLSTSYSALNELLSIASLIVFGLILWRVRRRIRDKRHP